jgi:hypothetical protein
MVLTPLQRDTCRLLARNRIASGESYVAGDAALNELLSAPRLSRDLDLFHDTDEALAEGWKADRAALEANGFSVHPMRERPTLVEAEVSRGPERIRMEWDRDSAFRFFPLELHDELGLTLHRFDLATNKVLALVGRLEVRDWVDVIASDARVQPLGFLVWSACAKDPAFGPASILEAAARSGRYSAEEVATLSFTAIPPDAGELARSWHRILDQARRVVALLPPAEAGTCVLDDSAALFRGSEAELTAALRTGRLRFHRGRIGGVLPKISG